MDHTNASIFVVAVCCADPALAQSLERTLRNGTGISVAGIVDQPEALLELIDRTRIDAVLADAPSLEQFAERQGTFDPPSLMVLLDTANEDGRLDMLDLGARAILPPTADGEEILAAIKLVGKGHVVLPHQLVATLLDGRSDSDQSLGHNGIEGPRLTPRELEVLSAMADGASNKAIARRFGISFHTAKFHVAAILAKLDADSRTEAVTKAAQWGLVML